MINKALLIGRLTKEPEVKYLQNGTTVASFNLAVDRTFKNKDGEKEADFIPIVVWRKLAELCEKYLTKGSLIAVVGRIQTRNYEAQDGTKRYVTEVVADEIQFLSSAKKTNGNAAPEADLGIPDIPEGFTQLDDGSVPF